MIPALIMDLPPFVRRAGLPMGHMYAMNSAFTALLYAAGRSIAYRKVLHVDGSCEGICVTTIT